MNIGDYVTNVKKGAFYKRKGKIVDKYKQYFQVKYFQGEMYLEKEKDLAVYNPLGNEV